MRAAGARPRVSVVIATYDRLSWLRKTLASVYDQTFRDFEVVVVDDASPDDTARRLRGHGYPGLTVLRNARNLGPSRSRNRAVARSRGELIAFLDDDDLWRPDYLEKMLSAFRRPAVMFACCDNDVIDGRGRTVLRRAMRRRPSPQVAFLGLSGLERVPAFSATMVRRAAWDKVGGLDESFRLYADDSDFAFRVGLQYGPQAFEFVDKSLSFRRIHRRRGAQISSFCDLSSPAVLEAFRAECGSFDERQWTIFFDILLHAHKHRWWADLLLHG